MKAPSVSEAVMYIFSYRKIVNIALSTIDSTIYDAYNSYFWRRKLKVTSTQFKQWREFMGISQQEAARALGLSKGSIELYERGSRRDDDRPVVVPRAVELACAALMHGITSYNEPQPAPAGSFQVIRIDLGGYGEQISRTVVDRTSRQSDLKFCERGASIGPQRRNEGRDIGGDLAAATRDIFIGSTP
jgi:transcriptional regulator with XRE-family HTH domain